MHHAHIDKLAYQDSPIHRLDARVKLIAILAYTVFVIAVPRYSVSILACYAVAPFAMLTVAGVSFRFIAKHLLIVSPFIAVLAISSIYYNRTPVQLALGPWVIDTTLGTLQFCNILGKFFCTMAALMALVCTTRFSDLLAAMQSLKVPHILVTQLGFLYRYIFILIDRIHHIIRARSMRTLRRLGFKTELSVASAMVGSLFISTLEASGRINMAMQARGFDGTFRTARHLKTTHADYIFVGLTLFFLVLTQVLQKNVT
ncbi:MAG: cobalt ECF transporter T component CbiQ [Planctomycetes bacterium GWF2_50_10]|nr:MAG: cobalt ECF transporter T component CbiQ [Planctomycetes bacterium GWF2_50_10]